MKVQLKKSIRIVSFYQDISDKTKSSQATLRVIAGMEFPIPIGIENSKQLSYKALIWTWSDDYMKYCITQYGHIMEREGWCKYFLNFREPATSIMNSISKILK